jgi:serpin B
LLIGGALMHLAGCSRQEQARPEPDRTVPVPAAVPRESPPAAVSAGAVSAGAVSASAGVAREEATPGTAVMAFAMDLHRVWRADPARARKTTVLSPLSVAGALAMVQMGARGETEEELARTLHLSPRIKAAELLGLEQRSSATFEIARAQRAFVDRRVRIEPAFRGDLKGALALTDFHDPEAARTGINRWVATATKKRILTLLPPGAVDASTRLVLVDALVASARWASPFDPAKSRPAPFKTLDGNTADVPMMFGESRQRFAFSEKYDAIDFACADQEHALFVVAPKEGHFDDVDAALDIAGLERIVASLAPGKVHVTMPRFQAILPATSLGGVLRALGVERAFDDRADLRGITTGLPLRLADVFHAARIDVDESGAKVAAATGAVIGLPSPVKAITLDRPFLFWLRNARTGAPIVMGRFMGPS